MLMAEHRAIRPAVPQLIKDRRFMRFSPQCSLEYLPLLLLQGFHGDGLGRAALGAERAANTLLFVLDDGARPAGRKIGGGHTVAVANQGVVALIALHLGQVHEAKAIFRADVHTSGTQDALGSVENGVDLALQAAQPFGAALGLIETEFHLGEADAAGGGEARPPLPRKTPGAVVMRFSSILRIPRGVTCTSSWPPRNERSACCPMARTTLSHGITFSWSLNAGLKRPFSSKTETQARTLRPVTTPSAPTISFGPQEFSTAMPSCSASSTSLCQAGICRRDSRLTRHTCSAPDRIAMRAASKAGCKLSSPDSAPPDSHDSWTRRTAARATSMATLPPPTTTTRLPSSIS